MNRLVNLVGKTPEDIEHLLAEHVDREYRARQIARWVVRRQAADFAEMSDLPKTLRAKLAAFFEIRDPEVQEVLSSADGSRKYLFRLADGQQVEGVAMLDRRKATFCLSSQVGCALGCSFCVTGALGSGRNLEVHELVGQFRIMLRAMEPEAERANIVFMGMGEPLLNTDNLGAALEVLYHRVSPKRITVSTAGVLPGIRWLAGLSRRPKLAVSLNAADQATRVQMMPISKTYPLEELITELRRFPLERGRRITFEYVLIDGVNTEVKHGRALVGLLHGIPSKINLIPFNRDPVHLPAMRPPGESTIDTFAELLRDAGLTVTVRRSKGADVAAACGQLKGARLGSR